MLSRLVLDNMDLVGICLRRVCGPGTVGYLEQRDIRQAGYEGLVQAAQRYQPDQGTFRNFAQHRIVGAMRDTMAASLRSRSHVSLDDMVTEDDDGLDGNEVVGDGAGDLVESAVLAREAAMRLLEVLPLVPARHMAVLYGCYWCGLQMEEIGAALGVSGSRASQMHGASLRALRVLLSRPGST